jgi:hypothetical protein
MQPYFFPYLGHFALIAAVDEWVVFDVTQYTRKSWMNRNRVLHPEDGWQYISIPLKDSTVHMRTFEARVASLKDAKGLVLGKLSHYARRAPYYEQVQNIIKETFECVTDDSLVSLNASGLRAVCGYLNMPFNYRICSELQMEYPSSPLPGEWAPWISGRLGASVYINPVGGRELFDPSDFAKARVCLQFLEFESFIYETRGYTFQNNLSILDVLMWNKPQTIMQVIETNSSLV